jgi:hypothetical protein
MVEIGLYGEGEVRERTAFEYDKSVRNEKESVWLQHASGSLL